ncbi:MAG: membrane protein insertion efficiency factor YidD [Acidimicrobiaceae bacterium]|nr:membrane protein insertion efficiency factor YidD [Acidimicrobiaceae bacterium]MCY4175127.1 membrane protein insertion efficiency factor YidD [Acidimicrobiaceae bacterium]MCY4279327.1 membrane protein insertion efficiency factor YidD [Acidimicrobiaceae bacterium]MCY4294536.1 membrane protein insertion efficiency factor YidD [Acidimicrobiaceae bacterium]
MTTAASRLVCRSIREYQLARAGRAPTCRFAPSCSSYAHEAVQRHGALKGLWLAAGRLLRCHPWAPLRADAVPGPADAAARREGFDNV